MLLDERELTAEERIRIADEARPGVWVEEREIFHKVATYPLSLRTGEPIEVKVEIDRRGDGSALNQQDTDRFIVAELHVIVARDVSFCDQQEWIELSAPYRDNRPAHIAYRHEQQQRGGIHSDPMIRLLAYRAWGDRDRRWRKRDTAKAMGGSIIDKEDKIDAWRRAYGFDGVALYHQELKRRTLYEASRDGRHASADFTFDQSLEAELSGPDSEDDLILDAFDTIDAKLAAGVNEPSQGPTFELG